MNVQPLAENVESNEYFRNLGQRTRNAMIKSRKTLAEKSNRETAELLNRSLVATGRRTFAQSQNNRSNPPVERPPLASRRRVPVNFSKQPGHHLAPVLRPSTYRNPKRLHPINAEPLYKHPILSKPLVSNSLQGRTSRLGLRASNGVPGASTVTQGAQGATRASNGVPGASTGLVTAATVAAPTEIVVNAGNMEKFEGYKTMLKMGVPIEGIEQKMLKDGINPEKIPLYSSKLTGNPIAVKTENLVKVNQPVANSHKQTLETYKTMKNIVNRPSLILQLKQNKYNPVNVFEDYLNSEYNTIMADIKEKKIAQDAKNAEQRKKKRLAQIEALKQVPSDNQDFFKSLSDEDKGIFLKAQQMPKNLQSTLWSNSNTRNKFFKQLSQVKAFQVNPKFAKLRMTQENQAKLTVEHTQNELDALSTIKTLKREITTLTASKERIQYKKVNGKLVLKSPLASHNFGELVRITKEITKKEEELKTLETPELLAKVDAVIHGILKPIVQTRVGNPLSTIKENNRENANTTRNNRPKPTTQNNATKAAANAAMLAARPKLANANTTRNNRPKPTTQNNATKAAANAAMLAARPKLANANMTRNNRPKPTTQNNAAAAAKAEKAAKKAKLEALFAKRAAAAA